MNYYGSDTGELLTKRLLGQQGGGTGKVLVAGLRVQLQLGEVPLVSARPTGERARSRSAACSPTSDPVLESEDPNFDGTHLYKVGTEVTYRCLVLAPRSPAATITSRPTRTTTRELRRDQPQADLPERLEQPRAGQCSATRAGSTGRTPTVKPRTTTCLRSSTIRCSLSASGCGGRT